jgi:integrase
MDKLYGKKKGQIYENKTPVIPVSIYRPLTAAALEYVLKNGESIIGVWQEMLDIWTKEIGVRWRSETTRFERLQIATTNILSKHDSPWRRTRWKSYGDVYDELNQLRRACMIVILAYSGVRDSELLSACAGCCTTDTDENGQPTHFLDTILHKHRKGGVRDTWVIIEEVVKAIRILEKLTERARTQSGEKHLFISDRSNYLFSVQKKFGPGDLFVLTESSIIYQLNAFVKFQNKVGRENTIPEWVDDKNISKHWHLNARQFRRTLAHHIARQPFGVIAGMLQYKRVEARVFEGYAGIDGGFNRSMQHTKNCVCRRSVADEVPDANLLHGQPEGIDVGALESWLDSSRDRETV